MRCCALSRVPAGPGAFCAQLGDQTERGRDELKEAADSESESARSQQARGAVLIQLSNMMPSVPVEVRGRPSLLRLGASEPPGSVPGKPGANIISVFGRQLGSGYPTSKLHFWMIYTGTSESAATLHDEHNCLVILSTVMRWFIFPGGGREALRPRYVQ